MDPAADTTPSTRALLGYFLRLGALGFGGPIALTAAMHRDLVERRRWLGEGQYLEGLALAQLAPGPLAAQLAIYIGWLHGRTWGAAAVGLAFVAPSFVMVLAIAAAYVEFGGLPWMQAAFYGIGAAVIAIILRGAIKLARVTIRRDRLLWAVLLLNAAATAWLEREVVLLIIGCGLIVVCVRTRPAGEPALFAGASLAIMPALPAAPAPLALFWFFAKAGAFVFGSGLAIVPFLYGGVVTEYGWLTEAQFVDAVAVAMITPGPVVITVAFIGFLVDGWRGAAVSALGVFLPCWILVVVPAPYFARHAANPTLRALIAGVTAAAAGAILGAVGILARRSIVDVPTLCIFGVTLVLLWRVRRVPEAAWIALAGGIAVLGKIAI